MGVGVPRLLAYSGGENRGGRSPPRVLARKAAILHLVSRPLLEGLFERGSLGKRSERAGVELWRVRAGGFKKPFRRHNGATEGMGQAAGGEVHRWDSGLERVAAAPAIGGGKPQAPVGRR